MVLANRALKRPPLIFGGCPHRVLYYFFCSTGNFWPSPHGVRLPGEAVQGGAGAHRHHNALWPHGGSLRPGEVSAKIRAALRHPETAKMLFPFWGEPSIWLLSRALRCVVRRKRKRFPQSLRCF